MPFDADAYRRTLGERLIRYRGPFSLYSTGESGISYRITQRIERAETVNIPLTTLFLLCSYYERSLGALLDPYNDVAGTKADVWPRGDEPPPSMPETAENVRASLRTIRHKLGWGTRRISKLSGLDLVRPSWLFRIESGEVQTLDVVRLAACMDVMGTSIVDLLPLAHRPPGQERFHPDNMSETDHEQREAAGTAG
jgi:hypothetical protein